MRFLVNEDGSWSVLSGPELQRFESDVPAWEGFVFTCACRAFCPKDEPVVDGMLRLPGDTWTTHIGVGKPYLAHVLIPGGPVTPRASLSQPGKLTHPYGRRVYP